jgi:hypothetical protein
MRVASHGPAFHQIPVLVPERGLYAAWQHRLGQNRAFVRLVRGRRIKLRNIDRHFKRSFEFYVALLLFMPVLYQIIALSAREAVPYCWFQKYFKNIQKQFFRICLLIGHSNGIFI